MTRFIPGGPQRYPHQVRGLRKLIETGGTAALLFEPGLGKTATTLDFLSILALKAQADDHGVQEIRVLVVAPLAAIDTWVKQAELWLSPQVNFWAEAIGGSIQQKAATLAARGGQPMATYRATLNGAAVRKPKRRFRTINGVKQEEPVRAEGWQRAIDWNARTDSRTIHQSDGPDGLGKSKPRIVLEVVNYDMFSSRQRVGSKLVSDIVLDGIKRFAPHMVVLDESHKIKGFTSNTSRLLDRVGQTVARRTLLTGTVMPAGPLDVFAQWRFLDPYEFGELQPDGSRKRATMDGFKGEYAVMGGYLGHEVVGYRNLERLQQKMAHRAVVALKKDELDLPPVIKNVVPVMLTAKEKQAYQDMKKDLAVQLSSGVMSSSTNRLTQMMRLRQITSGHLPDDFGNTIEVGTSKVDTIASLVEDTLAGEKRIVVFCLFRHELSMISKRLAQAGTRVLTISGDTPDDERIRMRQEFGRPVADYPTRLVMVAQIRTMSLAVNELVTAQNVIFGSLSQQRDDLIQAIDRLNRIGQEGTSVNVWFVEAPGTIDAVIHQSHDDRTKLEDAVLAHILGEDDLATQDRALRPAQELSDEGARTTAVPRAEAVEVVEVPSEAVTDGRFPGATSLTSAAISDAVGIFYGEDEEEYDDGIVDLTSAG